MVTSQKSLFANNNCCGGGNVYFNGVHGAFLNAQERREPRGRTEIATLIETHTSLL